MRTDSAVIIVLVSERRGKMGKRITAAEAAGMIKEGYSVMIGGFIGCGAPETIITGIIEAGTSSLHLIGNDTGFPDKGIGRLVVSKQAKKVTASHLGTKTETIRQMVEGELEVELIPQGTLAEKIRAAGAGLGGILTPTGIGTEVEDAKLKIEVNGKQYLLEEPVRADVAIIKAYKADERGNLVYHLTARNFNPLMAMAADLVIAEVEEILPLGELGPDEVITPHIFVDYLVKEGDAE